MDADGGASLRARGHVLDEPGALGLLLRERPEQVLAHHRAEAACHVDVLTALTADTTPRALAEVGMQHRAALLTGLALELGFDARALESRPIAVAGVLGSDRVGPTAIERLHEELAEHAARLHAAAAELIIARGQGSRRSLLAAVAAAGRTRLPTWAVVEHGAEVPAGCFPQELAESLRTAGASVVLFEVPSVQAGLGALERGRSTLNGVGVAAGVLLAASARAVRGFCDDGAEPHAWAEGALALVSAGARVLGGGAGTTERHTRALASVLGALHPSLPPSLPREAC